MSAFEALLFEIYIRAFGDPILGILVFFVVIAGSMFMMRVPASASLPISYVLVVGLVAALPNDNVLKPIEATLLMGTGVLITLMILALSKRR